MGSMIRITSFILGLAVLFAALRLLTPVGDDAVTGVWIAEDVVSGLVDPAGDERTTAAPVVTTRYREDAPASAVDSAPTPVGVIAGFVADPAGHALSGTVSVLTAFPGAAPSEDVFAPVPSQQLGDGRFSIPVYDERSSLVFEIDGEQYVVEDAPAGTTDLQVRLPLEIRTEVLVTASVNELSASDLTNISAELSGLGGAADGTDDGSVDRKVGVEIEIVPAEVASFDSRRIGGLPWIDTRAFRKAWALDFDVEISQGTFIADPKLIIVGDMPLPAAPVEPTAPVCLERKAWDGESGATFFIWNFGKGALVRPSTETAATAVDHDPDFDPDDAIAGLVTDRGGRPVSGKICVLEWTQDPKYIADTLSTRVGTLVPLRAGRFRLPVDRDRCNLGICVQGQWRIVEGVARGVRDLRVSFDSPPVLAGNASDSGFGLPAGASLLSNADLFGSGVAVPEGGFRFPAGGVVGSMGSGGAGGSAWTKYPPQAAPDPVCLDRRAWDADTKKQYFVWSVASAVRR